MGKKQGLRTCWWFLFATNKFQVLISFCILIGVCSRSYATLIFVGSLNIERVDFFAFLSAIGNGLFDCCLFVGHFVSFFYRCWYWPLLLLWAIQRPVALTVGRLLVGISLSLRLTWFPCLYISGGLVGCLGGRHIFCWSLQRDTNAKSSKVTFWCLVPSTMMAKNVKAKNLKSWKIILGFISVQTFICAMFWSWRLTE